MNPHRAPSKLDRIPQDLKDAYKRREITSFELAEKTGMNASYLRRALPRDPVQPRPVKGPLIAARKAYRASIAHLPVAEIVKLAHVSRRTAHRIKTQAATLSTPKEPPT